MITVAIAGLVGSCEDRGGPSGREFSSMPDLLYKMTVEALYQAKSKSACDKQFTKMATF